MSNKKWLYSIQCSFVIFGMVFLLYGIICMAWGLFAHIELKKKGQNTIATVININSSILLYDVEYQGRYYQDAIKVGYHVSTTAYKGEHFIARFLPSKMEHYDRRRKILFAPLYMDIALQRLPSQLQNVDWETRRIDSLYYPGGVFDKSYCLSPEFWHIRHIQPKEQMP